MTSFGDRIECKANLTFSIKAYPHFRVALEENFVWLAVKLDAEEDRLRVSDDLL